MKAGERVGSWEVIKRIGKGGQGEVFLVRDCTASDLTTDRVAGKLVEQLRRTLSNHVDEPLIVAKSVVEAIRVLAAEEVQPRLGALKRLLPLDEALNATTAHQRMSSELEALAAVSHPALVKVLDSNINDGWFVMEFLSGHTLATGLEAFRGDVSGALTAIRPLVDAVAHLHAKKIVHRDIKPDNIFVTDRTLVLGDCGLATRMDREERLTLTYENAGSRDWMPGWAMGMRLDEVSPAFDVFTLGKVLWAMVAGKSKLKLWYHSRPEFSLAKLTPAPPDLVWVQRILDRSVVEHEEDCLKDAVAMLALIDEGIEALRRGFQLPSRTRAIKCRFCGTGTYECTDAPGGYQHHHAFRCPECGHLEVFRFLKSEPPPAWAD